MKYIADFHIHSRYSRATSKDLNPENLGIWAAKKGISLVGTGDFTHPAWFEELKQSLNEKEPGLFCLKPELEKNVFKELPHTCRQPTRFILTVEISCIYKKGDKTRKLHHLILMPNFESAARLNSALDKIGNIRSDGRPILGLDSKILLEMVLEASDRAFFIPAHIWTPWFSLFGSKSGFDTIEECFEDLTPHIYALETGLSSDPPMNRLISALDKYLLVSNSDAHSASKLGREANIFDTEMDYDHVINAMKTGQGFDGTIEFYPEEGKYHLDGHRKCDICFHPHETNEHNGICPVCGKKLTVGVLNRITELADREEPVLSKKFLSLIPLTEIISEIVGTGPATKTVCTAYEKLLNALGPELNILMDLPLADIESTGGRLLSTAISRMREGNVIRSEGYDGEYGVIKLFHESERHELTGQKRLFENLIPESVSVPSGKKTPHSANNGNRPEKETIKPSISLRSSNPDQEKAISYDKGHLLIKAGPGTGKTMTLTRRIAHIVEKEILKPDNILALTFTNKAALEMKARTEKLLNKKQCMGLHISTFHRFCLDILRSEWQILELPPDFIICSEEDSALLAQEAALDEGMPIRIARSFTRELSRLKWQNAAGIAPEKGDEELLLIYETYQKKLRSHQMLDLADLEAEVFRLFRDFPDAAAKYSRQYPGIFVDEYQDTSPIQSAVLKSLVKDNFNRICAIGDPDQAIYGFRGADLNNFFGFTDDFSGAEEITLSINYRSTENVLRAASSVMKREAFLKGISGKGAPILITECATVAEEAEMAVEQIEKLLGGTSLFSLDSGRVASHEDGLDLGFCDIAVLYRMNSQGDAFEHAFNRAGIPYIRSGEVPLGSRYPVNVILRFLQVMSYPDNAHFRNMYDALVEKYDLPAGLNPAEVTGTDCSKGLFDRILEAHDFNLSDPETKHVIERLRFLADNHSENPAMFLDRLSLDRGIDHSALHGDRINLMTVHAAKGLEWPVVFITGCEDRLFPLSIYGDSNEDEERRLFYVGMTRAKQQLFLSSAKTRNINERVIDMQPSPFLSMIPQDLLAPVERSKWKRSRKKQTQLDLFSV